MLSNPTLSLMPFCNDTYARKGKKQGVLKMLNISSFIASNDAVVGNFHVREDAQCELRLPIKRFHRFRPQFTI